MSQSIMAHFDGKVFVPDEPVALPTGQSVRVTPAEPATKSLGIRDEDWPTDPEGIARLLALMDSLEPLEMTPEEEANWRDAVKSQNEYDRSQADARVNRIQRSFE